MIILGILHVFVLLFSGKRVEILMRGVIFLVKTRKDLEGFVVLSI